jgi:uncharacterized protein YciI
MQFMVVAYDGKDEQALERRLAVRDAHIKGAVALKQSGNLIAGGAILDDAGKMIGSTSFFEFDSREALDAWLAQDPYVTGDVWRDITITPIRLAV